MTGAPPWRSARPEPAPATALELLARLRSRDVRLWVEGDKLRYDAPAGALTDDLRAAVAELRVQLLELLRQDVATADLPQLVALPRGGELPLSSGQRRLWFIDQLDPGGVAYNVPVAVRLRGPLDRAALERALTDVVARHETLRSSFPAVDGEARLVIAPAAELDLACESLESHPEAERLEEARRRARAEALRPFDLARGPLMRVRLYRLAPDDHVQMITMHHIVSDGWSMGALFRELPALYRAHLEAPDLEGPATALPSLEVQYSDYAVWQAACLEHPRMARDLEYWLRQLDDLPAVALPTDRPRPPVETHRGAFEWVPVPRELFRELRAVVQREDSTSFQLLLAAFFVLLGRFTGQTDLVVGTPIAARSRKSLEGLIGFFVNNLVLRCDLSGDVSFRELLGQVRAVVLDAFAHQDAPFEKLVEELQPERDLGRNPLFQVLFNHFNHSEVAREFPPLELSMLDMSLDVAKFDLTLHCFEDDDSLVLKLEYSTDLFEAETIRRLGERFQMLLRSLVADPGRPLSRLETLTAAERRRLLVDWNDTTAERPAEAPVPTVVERFDEHAERTPDALALVFEGERLTWRQLAERATALAADLRARGVGPDVRVALGFERSADMVVALLGVLKAGGAYVPLDPTHPADRLAFVLEDSGAHLLLTTSELTARFHQFRGDVVRLDADPPAPANGAELPAPRPDHLAYVIYTSGSTGRPKGVAVEHGQLGAYVDGVLARLDLPSGSSFATVSTLAADLGNTSIFGALGSGGALHVFSDARIGDADAFGAAVEAEGIDCIKIVPSHLAALLDAARTPERVLPRRLCVLGGEALSWELVERIRRAAPDCRVIDHYGPTETTVGVLTHEVRPGDRERYPFGPPIGRPLPGVQVYLLDPAGQPVATGAVGEICVGGSTVARGYLDRPELTAESFERDPFGAAPGARLYRTGDRARRAPDGAVLFVGRIDEQVKIRGFRVEIGEVEAALSRHAAVASCAVQALATEGGRARLAAWVVPRIGSSGGAGAAPSAPTSTELADALRRELPEHMVPSSIVLLPELPRTPTGKLDRRALPAPDAARPAGGAAYAAPGTPTEETLAGIWADVLRVEQVGVHDDFFELGGESILSIQIVSRANREGLGLSPRDLFENPTIAALARRARRAHPATASAEQGPVTGPLPLTPIQHRFFELEPADPSHYNHALLFELRRSVTDDVLREAWAHLMRHHDALRLRLACADGAWTQVLAPPDEPVPFSTEDLSALPAPERAAALEARAGELQASLDLGAGPLLRVARFEMGPGERDRLLVAIHHVATDGVSWRILLEDLQEACDALSAGRPVRLPPKTTSVRTWAQRLAQYADSEELRAGAPGWVTALAAAGADLPTDHDVDAAELTARSVRVRTIDLDADATRALLTLVPRAYRTQVQDVLLTALARALAPWVAAPGIVVDLEGHGREDLFDDVDLSRTVGWFTAVYPLALDTAQDGWPAGPLKRTKEDLRAVAGRGIDWGVLRYLARDERLAALPTASIGFNYLGQLDAIYAPESLFDRAAESPGAAVGPENRRRYPLDVTASVREGRLRVNWIHDVGLHDASTIDSLAERFDRALCELIEHCTSAEAGGCTPSDFPLARLSQPELDRIVDRFGLPAIEDVYPASPLQQGMLFHTLSQPDSPAYRTQLAFTLVGEVDPELFRQAWEAALGRHPALRTAFAAEGLREIHQVVLRTVALDWREDDVRALADGERARWLDERSEEDRARGFDVQRAPLMRLRLARIADDRWRFVWTHHHALLDGWSLPLLVGEVVRTYLASRHGRAPVLEPVRPYSEYVAWLAQQDSAAAEAYWSERLADRFAPTPLPIRSGPGGARPGAGATMSARHGAALSEEATALLADVARTRHLTLNTLVQGAWALVLSRWSGESEVVFGVTVSGRPAELAGVETMMGLFLNTLPLVVDTGDDELVPWLSRIQSHQLELADFQYSPLYEIQRLSGGGAEAALFESFLVFENYPSAGLDEDRDLRAELAIEDGQDVSYVDYPLAAVIRPGRRLHLELRYDAGLFDTDTIERLVGHFRALLEAMARDPQSRLADLAMLSPAERQRELVSWNETRPQTAERRSVPALFEAQVARTPDAPAVAFADERWSYAELNRRANRLARFLAARGAGPGARVAVCVERTADYVASLLAVQKCGAAYVPLDAGQPAERLARVLADARPCAIVMHAATLGGSLDSALPVVDLDRDREAIGALEDTDLSHAGAPDDPAYVMYTSGSTGRPKGVVIPHRAIQRLALETDWVALSPADSVAQASNAAFDAATFEIFGALLSGARLVGVPTDALLSGPRLSETIRTEGLTVLFITTALFNQLAAEVPGIFAPLACLLFGGEAVDPERVRSVLADGPPTRLLHVYGPTENTTFSTWHEVRDVPPAATTVPIGRPIAGTSCYVLDADRQPVPAGAPGELYLGGEGLALGYLDDPLLTAERFVPNPFGDRGGAARLYRTGDLVRRGQGGAIEFLGRADHQVKLRGFRIELGEVEAALVRSADVRDAVVLCRQDAPGEKELVAYVAPPEGRTPTAGGLRGELKQLLPDVMVPTAFVFLEALPLTPNGKVDRRRLPRPGVERASAARFVAPAGETEERVATIWRDVLGLETVGVHDNFFDLGGHSLRLLSVHRRLVDELGADFGVTELFELPTVAEQADRLRGVATAGPELRPDATAQAAARAAGPGEGDAGAIAVVAMAGRFPGASTVERFWENLRDGVESVRFFTDDELRAAGVSEELIAHPRYVKARAVLDDVDRFDPWLFGFSPREAELTDPQQRVFLECAWEALERAGCDPTRFEGQIAVFAGQSLSSYVENLRSHPGLLASLGGMQGMLVADKDYLATRLSYALDLRGPSMTVQTACSTGLVAVHQACRSLIDGESDVALAGGVSITVPVCRGYLYEPGGIRSSDGHNRTFDARAEGTVTGSGAAIVVLKRLEDALAAGDPVHAVIRGSAVTNDGSHKVGFTAPSAEGQARAIAQAQAAAGVEPRTVTYVEAHGTATALGDPIEVSALTRVFRERTAERGFCALGSLKSNMGHLNEAAGVAGLIKTVLALEHAQIPPTLHYESPNPEIDFDTGPFFVNTKLRAWDTPDGLPRRAGVSSFGLGGTNAHVVVEEAPALASGSGTGPAREWQLLTLSGRTPEAAAESARNLAEHLRQHEQVELADAAYTLHVGRRELEHRTAVLVRDRADAIRALEGGAPERVQTRRAPARAARVAFLFPGHGHQHVDMGRGLYETEPVFRAAVDECLEHLGDVGAGLRAAIWPRPDEPADADAAAAALLERPTIFQPAVFVVDWAMAALVRSWGIEPVAAIGHSLGEYAAACLAGVLTLPDALRLVVLRGELMERTPPGAMLAISLCEADVRALLADEPDVWLSTINTPDLCLVSGEPAAVDALAARLRETGVEASPLAASHAYHSPMMESGVQPLVRAVREMALGEPRIPYLSNVTGDWIGLDEARDPEYFGRHLREPVRFADGMAQLCADEDLVLLEVGPGQIMSSLARMHPACGPSRPVVAAMRHPKADDVPDAEVLTSALGCLWTAGVRVDWDGFHAHAERRRVTLPTYPFQRERFWIERRDDPAALSSASAQERRPDPADWFHTRVWRRVDLPRSAVPEGPAAPAIAGERVLAFVDGSSLARRIVAGLESAGRTVVRVAPRASGAAGAGAFELNPRSPADYRRLVDELVAEGGFPEHVVHLWGLAAAPPVDGDAALGDAAADEELERGFFSLFHLGRALGAAEVQTPVRIAAVTAGAHEVLGDEELCPERAAVLGPCRVLGLELSNVECQNVDLSIADVERAAPEATDLLVRELLSAGGEAVVALRRGRRWVESFAPARLDVPDGRPAPVREGGTYLVTGGLTGVGFVLAGALSEWAGAKLVLVGRTPLPDRAQWDEHLAQHAADDPQSRRIQNVRALEEAGAEVLVSATDVADPDALCAAVAEAEARFGPIRGVIHAAGVAAGGLLMLQEPETPWRGFAPKVRGTRVLARLFRDRELDFLVLCSSLNAVVGTAGFVDYCAANAYLDVAARRLAAQTGALCVSIDWNRWREVGMAAEAAGAPLAREHGITNAEGIEVFRRILAGAPEPQVLVSEVDLWSVLSKNDRARGPAAQPTEDDTDAAAPSAPAPERSAHARPDLPVAYAAPETDTERVLAEIWQEVLGIDRVGAHDSFLELGGSSLLMLRVTNELEARTGVKVDLRALFHQTLAQIAVTIDERTAPQTETARPGVVRSFLSRLGASLRPGVESSGVESSGVESSGVESSGTGSPGTEQPDTGQKERP